MTGVLAAIRNGSVNFPLFLHVLGAMLLMGTLLAAALAIGLSWRQRWLSPGLTRFGLRALPYGVLPAYLLMRIGAQWTESQENLPEQVEDSAWIAIGYITADIGGVLILVAIIVAILGLRKLRAEGGGGSRLAGAAGIISALLVAVYVVTVWAMTTKPS